MGASSIAEMSTDIDHGQSFLHHGCETMPREQLARLQLQRLQATLRNACDNVPLHRQRFDAQGLRPQDIRTLSDLAQLPFTVKADLRDYYPFGLFTRPVEQLARLHASSGTTGKPTVVGYTADDLDTWADLMARSLHCAGARRGDVVHNACVYGLSEIMGPGVACECVCQSGLHGWEDHFLFEVIDPDTGRVLPEGEAGELVITTLTKQALPMLRYRTRDITRLTTAACDCGRTHVRILRITGRNDDMLIIRGVNVYPSQIEAVLVGLPSLAPHYLLVLERRGTLDQVRIEVEAEPGVDVDRYEVLAHEARHHIKSMIGITTDMVVQPPGTIPRSRGKAVRLRDLRPKGQP